MQSASENISQHTLAEDRLLKMQAHMEMLTIELEMKAELLRKTQVELEDARNRYADLYEFSPTGYLSISKHGMVTEMNWKATAMFGLKRKQLLRHNLSQLIAADDKSFWQRRFAEFKTFSAGQELSFDLNFVHNNGTIFSAKLNCQKMDDTEEPSILRITLVEITQLKQLERANRQTELRLQAILSALPDLIFELGLSGFCYAAHSNNVDLFDVPLKNFVGKSIQNLLPPEVAKSIVSAVKSAHKNANSVGKQFELNLAKKRHWFEISVSNKAHLPNDTPRYIVICRDITALKVAEEKLRMALSTFEMQDAVVITDANKTILRVNSSFTQKTGYLAEEVVGKNLSLLLSPTQHSYDFTLAIWECLYNTDVWDGDVFTLSKDGEIFPEYLNIRAVKNVGNVITNYVATFSEITTQNVALDEINNLAFYDQPKLKLSAALNK